MTPPFGKRGLGGVLPGIALWLVAFFAWPVSAEVAPQPHTQMQYIMGTLITISVFHADPAAASRAVSEAFAELRRQEHILSDYDPASELNQALKLAHKQEVPISRNLYEALDRSLSFSDLTQGAFDISVGPLVELWGFKNKQFRKPTPQAIQQVLQRVGYKHIALSDNPPRLFLRQTGMRLDFGGIGKGLAIGKAADLLKAQGIKQGRIDAVSNQYYLGAPPGLDCWPVAIRHPRQEVALRSFCVKDTAVSTSGDYEQYFIEAGIRYSHILDPRTGSPPQQAISATVIAADSALADALSTTLLLLEPAAGQALVRQLEVEQAYTIRQDGSGLKVLEYHR